MSKSKHKEPARLEWNPIRPGVQGQYDALDALWSVYYVMAVWGTEDYRDLSESDRDHHRAALVKAQLPA